MLYKVGKHTFVLGVDWYAPRDKKDAQRLRKQFKNKRPVSLYMAEQDLRLLGFAEPKEKGIIASCVIAKAFEKGCFIVELDEDHVWLCYVFDGHPASGFDKIVKKDDVRSELESLSNAIGEKIEPKLYAFDEEDEKSRPDFFWQTLTNRIDDGEIEKLSECIIGKISPLALFLIIGSFVLVFIAAWPEIKAMIFPEKNAVSSAVAPTSIKVGATVGTTSEDAKKQRHAKLKAAFERRLEDATHKLSNVQMLNLTAIKAIVESLPYQSYGYQPMRLNCDFQGCELTWQPIQSLGADVRMQDRFLLPNVDLEKTLLQGGDIRSYSYWAVEAISVHNDSTSHPEIKRIKVMDAWRMLVPKLSNGLTYRPFQQVIVRGEAEVGINDKMIGWKTQGTWHLSGQMAGQTVGQNGALDIFWLFADFAKKHELRPNRIEIAWENGKINRISVDFQVFYLNAEDIK